MLGARSNCSILSDTSNCSILSEESNCSILSTRRSRAVLDRALDLTKKHRPAHAVSGPTDPPS
ncbi:hypothetical protein GCM10027053_31110 [Intrasporangium mesophilum]